MSAAYDGRCHCGAIGFRYRTPLPPADWPVRACQCSFCRAHEVISTSHPSASIEFHADDLTTLQRYRFGLKTADFLTCGRCGVYIGAVLESDAGAFGIVNLRALTQAPVGLEAAASVSYDDEDAAGRVDRREERWAAVTGLPW